MTRWPTVVEMSVWSTPKTLVMTAAAIMPMPSSLPRLLRRACARSRPGRRRVRLGASYPPPCCPGRAAA
ncbi:hypothetical protein ABZ630_33030, partial [Streptomyces albidoflavus]|uniref:hypothetical protein n=1 Tax=Streptomyces albidoflavus TaxID=1886 RepID=UPI0033D1B965